MSPFAHRVCAGLGFSVLSAPLVLEGTRKIHLNMSADEQRFPAPNPEMRTYLGFIEDLQRAHGAVLSRIEGAPAIRDTKIDVLVAASGHLVRYVQGLSDAAPSPDAAAGIILAAGLKVTNVSRITRPALREPIVLDEGTTMDDDDPLFEERNASVDTSHLPDLREVRRIIGEERWRAIWLAIYLYARAEKESDADADDLRSKTFLALGSTCRWNPKRGAQFETRAFWVLKGMLSNHWRRREYERDNVVMNLPVGDDDDAADLPYEQVSDGDTPETRLSDLAQADYVVAQLRTLSLKDPNVLSLISDAELYEKATAQEQAARLGVTKIQIDEANKRIKTRVRHILAEYRKNHG